MGGRACDTSVPHLRDRRQGLVRHCNVNVADSVRLGLAFHFTLAAHRAGHCHSGTLAQADANITAVLTSPSQLEITSAWASPEVVSLGCDLPGGPEPLVGGWQQCSEGTQANTAVPALLEAYSESAHSFGFSQRRGLDVSLSSLTVNFDLEAHRCTLLRCVCHLCARTVSRRMHTSGVLMGTHWLGARVVLRALGIIIMELARTRC
jgi:hypothetical protein